MYTQIHISIDVYFFSPSAETLHQQEAHIVPRYRFLEEWLILIMRQENKQKQKQNQQ